jgi:hypothetical protein
MMKRIGFALAGGILLPGLIASLAGCGGAPPPKEPEAPVQVAPPPPPPPKQMKSSQELGQIDEDATNKTFQSLQDKLLSCQKDGLTRVEFLAGDAKFFLRIAQDGTVRWAFLEDSTLGDRDTEKCMIQVLSTARWPQPDGGEAEVQKSISFDSGDARPPVPWRSDKVAGVLQQEGNDALKCKGGTRGVFKVTAYVQPGEASGKHKAHGKVVAVGVAPPNKDAEAKADCIADAVKDWKMPSPGGYAAKVTFSL